VSQVLTLYTTPVIYLYMDRVGLYFKRGKESRHEHSHVSPHPTSFKDMPLS